MSCSTTAQHRIAWQCCGLFLLAAFLCILPDWAIAGNNTPMGNVLCSTAGWLTGNAGKGLATLAICFIGVWRLLGKMSGRITTVVGVGVAIIFGAANIVNAMNAGVGGVTTATQNCT